MKKIFLIVLLIFIVTSTDLAQQTPWQWVNPTPQGNPLNGFWAINHDSAFAVGGYGTVINTTDGGATWHVSQAVDGIYENLLSTKFISKSVGWEVGEYGTIFKTTNSGEIWSICNSPSTDNYFAVEFISESTGWITGGWGAIYKTTNSGTSWVKQSTGITNSINAIQFVNGTTGWAACSGGKILKTTDGGTTWVRQDSATSQTLFSINFISQSVGWATGTGGVILKTVNGGTNWIPQFSGTTVTLYSIHSVNAQTVWASGSYGMIRKTTNGGLAWFQQNTDTYNDLYRIQFISSTVGWAVGDLGTIVGTIDGGVTWQNLSSGPKNEIYAVNFPAPSTGYVVGDEGAILKTTNSGISWIKQSTGYYLPLYGVYFVNPSVGFAVGDSAVIFRTTNGGVSWSNQNSRTDITLYSIYFVTPSVGWAVGDGGTVLKTISGGISWLPQVSPTYTTLLRVQFVSELIGWAVGYSGIIIKTTDGGATWTEQVSGTGEVLYSLCFLDQLHGYAVGDFGAVIATTDGGNTWLSKTTNTDASLYGVTFSSTTTGWAVGDDGTIIKTTDSGNTWTLQASATINTLFETQFVRTASGGVIFAAGVGGTIICSGISPFPLRTWTGAYDSLWSTQANWNPVGTPEKIDSVYIPSTAVKPFIRQNTQQINIAALKIASGSKLTIGPELSQMFVKGNIENSGTLEISPTAAPEITIGGNFIVGTAGKFLPGKSTTAFLGNCQVKGSFYNILIKEGAALRSAGNIEIQNTLVNLSTLSLRPTDTLTIKNPDPYALFGSGIIDAGTIKRAISPAQTIPYQFESAVTYISFHQNGVVPDTVIITTYPKTLMAGLVESLFVKRYYSIKAIGGSNYLAYISLRYDTSETKISVDELALFKDSSGVITNMGQTDFLDSDLVAVSLDSVRTFSNWYLGYINYYPKHPMQFIDSLIIRNNGTGIDTLTFGALPGATDGIDTLFGETELSQKPNPSIFDTRWSIIPTFGSKTDIRDVFRGSRTENVYTCSFQPGSAGYPVQFRWNPYGLGIGSFFLQDSITQGSQVKVNMKLQQSCIISNPLISTVQIVCTRPQYYSFDRRWNMVSLPVTATSDRAKTTVFPTANSLLYKYSGAYTREDTLVNCRGYWIKFPTAQNINIDGFSRYIDTINVGRGWNMIGSISKPVAVSNVVPIPPNIIAGTIYGYSGNYYPTDSIRPARGYWIKASADGKLVLSSPPTTKNFAKQMLLDEIRKMNVIHITDNNGSSQNLYFGKIDGLERNPDIYEMPPPPPTGIFDARFSSNRIAENLSTNSPLSAIEIRSAEYPITLQWQLSAENASAITFTDALTGKIVANSQSSPSGSVKISNQLINRIIITINRPTAAPKEFALKQNYPNPFNPVTKIEFELPVQATVTLRIFNPLGQQIKLIAENQIFDAGSHSLVFDGSNFGTGTYFYQIIAKGIDNRNFQQVKKLILIK